VSPLANAKEIEKKVFFGDEKEATYYYLTIILVTIF
jgi:hypothetical protein